MGKHMSRIILALSLVAALSAGLAQAGLFGPTNGKSPILSDQYSCLSGAVKKIEARGISGLSEASDLDKRCETACKKLPDYPNYKPGNWALMERDHLDCCCGRAHWLLDQKYQYAAKRPTISMAMFEHMESLID